MPEELPRLALLAGGLATRLWPLTQSVPKSLVIVDGEPFLAHQLRLLTSHGIREVVLCAGHFSKQIEDFVGDGARFGCNVIYSHDGDKLLGTGGALQHALPLLGDCFLVMYGDSYLLGDPLQVWKAFLASGKPALMTIFRNDGKWDTSNVEMRDEEIARYSKQIHTRDMRYIDYGLSVMRAEVLHSWPEDAPFDLADIMSELALQGNLGAYEVYERFYEIGSHEGLREIEEYFSGLKTEPALAGERK